jgi:tetratricopeptide (TPR) repeat protein
MVRYALVATLWLCPALAAAQNASDTKAAADALFDEGKRLIAAGNVDQACAKFEASLQRLDRLGVRLNLADCHEQQGRTATARAEFDEAALQAKERGDDRAAYARQRADALKPRLARLAISVPPASRVWRYSAMA